MADHPTVLTIEDDAFLRTNIATYLDDAGYRVLEARTGEDGLDVFRRSRPDVILLDLRLPGLDGLRVLETIRKESTLTPVIIVSGMGILTDVVTALKLGAADYVLKPIHDMEMVLHAVRNAWEKRQLQQERLHHQEELEQRVAERTEELISANEELALLRSRLEEENAYLREEIYKPRSADPFVGQSRALRELLTAIDQVAPTEANVLVLGETGTGKELVARALHERSARRERPLIKVNCAAVPPDLFESEFFGHVRGAFSGATQDRVGRFQLADSGTLFLDEVAEIPLELQGKLLRVLQEKTFEPVGDSRTQQVDVRVIAATNRDPAKEVREGRLREDLYFRLNVFPIQVPPLRARPDDIGPLAQTFLDRFSRVHGIPKPIVRPETMMQLQAHPWPGNVRELENVIERAVITSRGLELVVPLAPVHDGSKVIYPRPDEEAILTETEIRQLERRNVLNALRATGGKVFGHDGAAALLGIKPTTLRSRIETMGITTDDIAPHET